MRFNIVSMSANKTEIVTISDNDQKVVKTATNSEEHPRAYQKKKAIFRTYQVVWYVLGIIEVLLAFRFAFEALGANSYSSFTSLIYALSYPFVQPFQGIFGVIITQRSIFDWSIIVAGIV